MNNRRGGDSNPRTRVCQVNSLAGSPIRPLSHLSSFIGERGIRTPGDFRLSSFQDCHHRPLGHLSNGDFRLSSFQDCHHRPLGHLSNTISIGLRYYRLMEIVSIINPVLGLSSIIASRSLFVVLAELDYFVKFYLLLYSKHGKA